MLFEPELDRDARLSFVSLERDRVLRDFDFLEALDDLDRDRDLLWDFDREDLLRDRERDFERE